MLVSFDYFCSTEVDYTNEEDNKPCHLKQSKDDLLEYRDWFR